MKASARGKYRWRIAYLGHIKVDADEEWSLPLHTHNDTLELSLISSGEGTLYYNSKTITVHKGDLLVKCANVPHAERKMPGEPFEQLYIGIPYGDLTAQQLEFVRSHIISPVLQTGISFPFLEQSIYYIAEICEKGEMYPEKLLDDVSNGFFSAVNFLVEKSSFRVQQLEISENIKQVMYYLDENYLKDIDLNDIARRFYISPCYLSRRFKQETDYSIKQYLINRRMGEAIRQLIFEETDIKEIALSCGYSNLQYFYNAFKKFTQCTPSEFREKYFYRHLLLY